jgi:transcriptional regulator with XRE-family HTH domain
MRKPNPVLLAFGGNIRKMREAKDLTQEALAERADLDRTYISGVERGVRNVIIPSILRIAKALAEFVNEMVRKGDFRDLKW